MSNIPYPANLPAYPPTYYQPSAPQLTPPPPLTGMELNNFYPQQVSTTYLPAYPQQYLYPAHYPYPQPVYNHVIQTIPPTNNKTIPQKRRQPNNDCCVML
jgi:hypothetical protein